MKYCPLCNWRLVGDKCTNVRSFCRYRGPGITRSLPDASDTLGDITGDPINNGDLNSSNYDDGGSPTDFTSGMD